MLVSSKVNQWTLLVGTLPLFYAISYGSATAVFHLGSHQVEEVFLTAAQSLFAVAILSNLRIARWEAVMLLVLFLGQFAFPMSSVRYGFAFAYVALFLALAVQPKNRSALWGAVRAALSRPRKRGTVAP
jgi:cation:H+ antiporter